MMLMIKNHLFKVTGLILSVFFISINIFMVKILPDRQINDSGYERLIKREGKIKLTQETLDRDHQNYIEGRKSSKKFFQIITIVLLSILVLLFIYSVFRLIKDRSKRNIKLVAILLVCIVLITVVTVFVFSSEVKEDESYKFDELNIKDCKSEKERKKNHWNYYLVLNSNKKIKVTLDIYNVFKDYEYSGIYYVGTAENGDIFSLYPSRDYELDF